MRTVNHFSFTTYARIVSLKIPCGGVVVECGLDPHTYSNLLLYVDCDISRKLETRTFLVVGPNEPIFKDAVYVDKVRTRSNSPQFIFEIPQDLVPEFKRWEKHKHLFDSEIDNIQEA